MNIFLNSSVFCRKKLWLQHQDKLLHLFIDRYFNDHTQYIQYLLNRSKINLSTYSSIPKVHPTYIHFKSHWILLTNNCFHVIKKKMIIGEHHHNMTADKNLNGTQKCATTNLIMNYYLCVCMWTLNWWIISMKSIIISQNYSQRPISIFENILKAQWFFFYQRFNLEEFTN